MKKSMMIATAGLGLLLAGCATQSPYVGTWETKMDDEVMALTMTETGAMMVELPGGDMISGSWVTNGVGKIELTAEGEEDVAIGTLMSDDDLIVTVEGETMKFTRKEIDKD